MIIGLRHHNDHEARTCPVMHPNRSQPDQPHAPGTCNRPAFPPSALRAGGPGPGNGRWHGLITGTATGVNPAAGPVTRSGPDLLPGRRVPAVHSHGRRVLWGLRPARPGGPTHHAARRSGGHDNRPGGVARSHLGGRYDRARTPRGGHVPGRPPAGSILSVPPTQRPRHADASAQTNRLQGNRERRIIEAGAKCLGMGEAMTLPSRRVDGP